MTGFRSVLITAACVVGLALSACSPVSSSGGLPSSAKKVKSAQALFDPTVPKYLQVKREHLVVTDAEKETARDHTRKAILMYMDDTRDRFPKLASDAGLTISPTAADQLRIVVVASETDCTFKCLTSLRVEAQMFDSSGRPYWKFTSRVTPMWSLSGLALRSHQDFDDFALKLLEAMKKDGIIGN